VAILQLCLVCLRVGTLVFGGGLVMVPLLQADVVDRYHWLTQQEFLDAVALGQMTPGPLLVTATFIGYKVGGVLAATLATICMFLPSFVMTLAASHNLKRLQGNRLVGRFLWGVRAAIVGLVIAAAASLGRSACGAIGPGILGLLALLVISTQKVDAGIVVVASGLVGLLAWSG